MSTEVKTVRYTIPSNGARLVKNQPLSEYEIQGIIEVRFTYAHRQMLLEKCKIAPRVLAQSGLFSLKDDAVAHKFLRNNGFLGANGLIGEALACPCYGLLGNLLGYTILNARPRLDERGNPVFYEEARDCLALAWEAPRTTW